MKKSTKALLQETYYTVGLSEYELSGNCSYVDLHALFITLKIISVLLFFLGVGGGLGLGLALAAAPWLIYLPIPPLVALISGRVRKRILFRCIAHQVEKLESQANSLPKLAYHDVINQIPNIEEACSNLADLTVLKTKLGISVLSDGELINDAKRAVDARVRIDNDCKARFNCTLDELKGTAGASYSPALIALANLNNLQYLGSPPALTDRHGHGRLS